MNRRNFIKSVAIGIGATSLPVMGRESLLTEDYSLFLEARPALMQWARELKRDAINQALSNHYAS